MVGLGMSCGVEIGNFVILGDFLIVLLSILVLAGTREVFVVKVAVILTFSVVEGSESQLRDVISWEGFT